MIEMTSVLKSRSSCVVFDRKKRFYFEPIFTLLFENESNGFSHCAGSGPEMEQRRGIRSTASNELCRNIHTGLRQRQELQPPANEVWGKVMFSQMFVCPQEGFCLGEGAFLSRGVLSLAGGCCP